MSHPIVPACSDTPRDGKCCRAAFDHAHPRLSPTDSLKGQTFQHLVQKHMTSRNYCAGHLCVSRRKSVEDLPRLRSRSYRRINAGCPGQKTLMRVLVVATRRRSEHGRRCFINTGIIPHRGRQCKVLRVKSDRSLVPLRHKSNMWTVRRGRVAIAAVRCSSARSVHRGRSRRAERPRIRRTAVVR